MIEVKKELSTAIDKELSAYRVIKQKEVKMLNDLIRNEITDFIKLDEVKSKP